MKELIKDRGENLKILRTKKIVEQPKKALIPKKLSRSAVPSDNYSSGLWPTWPLLPRVKKRKHCYKAKQKDQLRILLQLDYYEYSLSFDQ